MNTVHVSEVILVPLDGSPLADTAITNAVGLCGPGDRLILLRVLPAGGGVLSKGSEGARAVALQELEASRAHVPATIPAELAIAEGDPASAIVDAALEHGASMISIATRGRGAIGRWLFGSVADRVARTSTLPVMIARGEDAIPEPVTFTRLVMPLDGSELSMSAIPAAVDLCVNDRLSAHLLTAIDVTSLMPVAAPGGAMPMAGNLYEEVYEEMTQQANADLESAKKAFADAGVEVTTEVRVGPPIVAIEDVVKDGDVIVMTSHGRTGVQRWLLGSVAEYLVRNAPVPLVLVPIKGRETASA